MQVNGVKHSCQLPQIERLGQKAAPSCRNRPCMEGVQSMSSDGQWTADDEREQQMGTSTSELRDAKAYYDPTKPDSHEPSVFGDDNGDEINVSSRKKQSDSDDNTRANFTPVMLYRFLFG